MREFKQLFILMHIDFIKINKSMHNYSYVVVLVLRLTGQFLFIYFFFIKDILNVKNTNKSI